MTLLGVGMAAFGIAVAAAGGWWLWGGRWGWLPAGRMHRAMSEPTRLVIGLAHLVLGYHLVVWALPERSQQPLQISREHWHWLAIGCCGVIGASLAIDRWAPMDEESEERGGRG